MKTYRSPERVTHASRSTCPRLTVPSIVEDGDVEDVRAPFVDVTSDPSWVSGRIGAS